MEGRSKRRKYALLEGKWKPVSRRSKEAGEIGAEEEWGEQINPPNSQIRELMEGEVLTPSKQAQNGRGGAVTQRRILEFLVSKRLEDEPRATISPATQDYEGGGEEDIC